MRKGLAYILIATFAFAWMNIIAKSLSNFHPLQVVFFRAFGNFCFIFPFMLYNKISVIGNNPRFLFLRAFVGFISLATFFMAIQRIPLGSAISIRYIGPIFGAVLAYYYLKEKISSLQWFSFIIAFSGVLVLKGVDLRIDLFSFGLVLISAFFVGMVFALIRYLGSREHYLTIINYFMVVSIIGTLFFIQEWRMPIGWQEWSLVVGIGMCGLIGQVFMTQAFQMEEASVLAPFKYMELVYALIVGFLIFNEEYSWAALGGMGLIIVGMILNVYGKKQIATAVRTKIQ